MNRTPSAFCPFRLAAALFVSLGVASTAQAFVHYKLSDDGIGAAAFSNNSEVLYAFKKNYGTVVYRWETSTRLSLPPVHSPVANASVIAIAPNVDLVVDSDYAKHYLWKLSTGELVATLPDTKTDKFLALSPDGQTCVLSKGDVITLWKIPQAERAASLNGHEKTVEMAVFSPDGRRLVSIAGDRVRMWDVARGALIGSFPCPAKKVLFSPDGNYLFIDQMERAGTVWDARTLNPVAALPEADETVFSGDGKYVYTKGSQGTYRWVNDPSQFRAVEQPKTAAERLAQLADIEQDKRANDLPVLKLTRVESTYHPYAISPDGRWFVSHYRDLVLLPAPVMDLVASTALRKVIVYDEGKKSSIKCFSIKFSPDGGRLAANLEERIDLWDVKGRSIIRSLFGSHVRDDGRKYQISDDSRISFSADGKFLTAQTKEMETGVRGGMEVWETESGRGVFSAYPGKTVPGMLSQKNGKKYASRGEYASDSFPAAFHPKENMLATVAPLDSLLVLIDTTKGKPIHSLLDPTRQPGWREPLGARVDALEFSADGRMLLSTHFNVVSLWDTTSGKWIRNFVDPALNDAASHYGNVYDAVISPDGQRVVSSSEELKVWETQTGRLLKTVKGSFGKFDFAPDGRFLATSGGAILDANTLDVVVHMDRKSASDVSYSPDGRYLAVSSGREIRFYDSEMFPGLFFAPTIDFDLACWIGQTLKKTGYFNAKANIKASVFREGDFCRVALALPDGVTGDNVIMAALQDELGPALAERLGPHLSILVCTKDFQVERTLEIDHRTTAAAASQPPGAIATIAASPASTTQITTLPFLATPATAPADEAASVADALKGAWRVEKMLVDGKPATFDKAALYRFDGTRLAVETPNEPSADMTYAVDASTTPIALDLTLNHSGKKTVSRMIYKIENDTLTICHGLPNSPRPTEFTPTASAMRRLILFRRVETGL
jgi:uncharacterized protein (TIGR03067 family)